MDFGNACFISSHTHSFSCLIINYAVPLKSAKEISFSASSFNIGVKFDDLKRNIHRMLIANSQLIKNWQLKDESGIKANNSLVLSHVRKQELAQFLTDQQQRLQNIRSILQSLKIEFQSH